MVDNYILDEFWLNTSRFLKFKILRAIILTSFPRWVIVFKQYRFDYVIYVETTSVRVEYPISYQEMEFSKLSEISFAAFHAEKIIVEITTRVANGY